MFLITSSEEFKESIAANNNAEKLDDPDEHQSAPLSNQDSSPLIVEKKDNDFKALLEKVFFLGINKVIKD